MAATEGMARRFRLRRMVWRDGAGGGCGGWYGVTVQAVAAADGMAVSAQDVK